MKFLGNVLAVIVGLFVFSIVSMLIFFGIIGMIAASSDEEVTLEENTILHLDLNGRTLVERTTEEDLELEQEIKRRLILTGNAAGIPNPTLSSHQKRAKSELGGINLIGRWRQM